MINIYQKIMKLKCKYYMKSQLNKSSLLDYLHREWLFIQKIYSLDFIFF